jgi:DNA-binding transcriptional LysR family regulator
MNKLQSRLQVRHISVVLAIARLGSMQKAAESLHLSQSAVSKSLAEIEEIAGAQLFERTPFGTKPTIFGETLVHYGQMITVDLQRASEELDTLLRGDSGHLTIGIFSALSWWDLIGECILEFQSKAPKLTISIVEQPMEDLLNAFDEGAIDIVIGRLPKSHHKDSYFVEPLCESKSFFIARENHPIFYGKVTLERIVDFPWILPPATNFARRQLEFSVREAGLRVPAETIASQAFPLSFRIGRQNNALVLIPGCIAPAIKKLYGLHHVPYDLPLNLGPLVGITRNDRNNSVYPSMFLTHLKFLAAQEEQESVS